VFVASSEASWAASRNGCRTSRTGHRPGSAVTDSPQRQSDIDEKGKAEHKEAMVSRRLRAGPLATGAARPSPPVTQEPISGEAIRTTNVPAALAAAASTARPTSPLVAAAMGALSLRRIGLRSGARRPRRRATPRPAAGPRWRPSRPSRRSNRHLLGAAPHTSGC
jgi:hypothetical protein